MAATAYIALGSNLGDREFFLRQALDRLTQAGAVAPQLVKLRERKQRFPDTPFRVFG